MDLSIQKSVFLFFTFLIFHLSTGQNSRVEGVFFRLHADFPCIFSFLEQVRPFHLLSIPAKFFLVKK